MSVRAADVMVEDLVSGIPAGERRTLAEVFVRRLMPGAAIPPANWIRARAGAVAC